MYLAGEIKETANPRFWAFTGEIRRFHALSDLSALLPTLEASQERLRRYLGLRLTFELNGKRKMENELTPAGKAVELIEPQGPLCKFNVIYAQEKHESDLRYRQCVA